MTNKENKDFEKEFQSVKDDLIKDEHFHEATEKAETMFQLLLGMPKDVRKAEMVELCYARASIVAIARPLKELNSSEFIEKCKNEPLLRDIAQCLATYATIVSAAQDSITTK